MVEGGIEKFIKFALIIVQGFMTIKDIIPKVRAQLEALFKSQGPPPKPPAPGEKSDMFKKVTGILEKFQKGWSAFQSALKKFNFQDVTVAATTFLSLVPDILLAIMTKEQAEAVPSLTEWQDAAVAAGKSVEERDQLLKKGAEELLASISPETQARIATETALKLKTVQARAQVAAQILAPEIRMQATFPQFVAAFRAELVKVP